MPTMEERIEACGFKIYADQYNLSEEPPEVSFQPDPYVAWLDAMSQAVPEIERLRKALRATHDKCEEIRANTSIQIGRVLIELEEIHQAALGFKDPIPPLSQPEQPVQASRKS